jgi:hypothetical protein
MPTLYDIKLLRITTLNNKDGTTHIIIIVIWPGNIHPTNVSFAKPITQKS